MKQVKVIKDRLKDTLDLKLLERYLNQLHNFIQVPIMLLDLNGEIIFASRKVDIYDEYKQENNQMKSFCKHICTSHDLGLLSCPNGLMMYKFPVKVKNETIAYFVLHQFFVEGMKFGNFVDILKNSKLEESRISDIIDNIPILDSKRLNCIIDFIKSSMVFLHKMINDQIKVIEFNILNNNLIRKNNNNERRYYALAKKMKQGIIILGKSRSYLEEEQSFHIVELNDSMRRMNHEFRVGVEDTNTNIEKYDVIKYIISHAENYKENANKKTFFSQESKRYFEIEYEKISDDELMVWIQDMTIPRNKIIHQKRQIWDVVSVMRKLVEKRDLYTAEHQKKVAILAARIGIDLGIDKSQIESIFIASLLHDIGKITIPLEILAKSDKLSEIEFELIKTHVDKGYEMLKDINFGMPIAEIIKQHHEKINGSGYPNNLHGNEMMLESKIIAVADVYEAITSHRPYRPSLGVEYAKEYLIENKSILYDSAVVDVCISVAATPPWTMEDVYNYLYNNDLLLTT